MTSSGQRYVKVAQHAVGSRGEVIATLGLGSCVAVVLSDAEAGVGGMAHVLLPEPSLARDVTNPAKFATTAVPLLVEEIRAAGGDPARLRARMVGGASMFAALMGPGSLNMGERNVRAVREALRRAGIRVDGEAVGGDHGRSVRYDVAADRVTVSSVGRNDVVL